MQQCIDNSQYYKSLCYGELMKMMFHIRYIGRKEVKAMHEYDKHSAKHSALETIH